MRLKTEFFSPCGLSTRSGGKMAYFGFHDTHITLREANKTAITVALVKAFFNGRIAMHTDNLAGINQADCSPY
ncbi:hypothetical protein CRENPOLYSF1_230025 [Crenothrix polyspora]|uniref:Uncharacterized protein n=1 Tax=Crenothrix polyspora TaxID=360316 RepID=A0A1R4H6W2_9GAMM|nr:hypothetical protein CRENPOLYSF1_230025 [Crenothrix polyspora]